jgi:integrase
MPLKIVRRKDTGSLTIIGTIKLPDGSRQRIRARAQSDELTIAREEAAALEVKILRDAWHGKRLGDRSFGQAVIAYIESAERSLSTKRRLNRLLRAVGDVPLSVINQQTVIRARQLTLSPTASSATVRRGIVTPLRAVMNHAHRLGWCGRAHFETPREPEGRTRYLLPDEARRLLAAASPHIRVLVMLLLCTGARMSEALELRWRDVDLVGARAIFWRTKTGKRRNAFLPPAAIAALSSLLHRDGAVIRRGDGLPYVDRERQGGGQIKTAWKATLRRAGLDPELTPHDLRHTWASWHYALHRDLLALKIEGSWSSVALVERYAHLMPAGHDAEIKAFWHAGVTVVAVSNGTH